jgi:hypothetical protein
MASVVYPEAREAFLQGNLDLDGDVRIILVDSTDYTYNAAHDFLDDVPSGARVGTSTALQNKTFSGGVFDSDNITVTGVTGDTIEVIIGYQHTGTESTSRLIWFMDSASAGLPLTPNGGDVTVTWNASGIFAL